MRAILIAAGDNPGMAPLTDRRPTPMMPLLDRPFLQHVVEFLVEQGVTAFEFVLSHMPEQVEDYFGDGTRWGSRFRFHLARDAARPYNLIGTMPFERADERILLAHTEVLPNLQVAETGRTSRLLLVYHSQGAHGEDEKRRAWSGWARLPAEALIGLPKDLEQDALETHLLSAFQGETDCIEVAEVLGVRSHRELIRSHRTALDGDRFPLILSGREVQEGLRLSRNVSLHPTARVVAPAYVGENCRIGPGVQVGPNAFVGSDCVLDTGCTVQESVIFPGSYVGEALELDEVIVDHNRLVNVRVGAAVSVSDDFVLGRISDRPFGGWISRAFSRILAIFMLLLAWPILAMTALFLKLFRRGPVVFRREVIRLPAALDPSLWRRFRLCSFCEDTRADGSQRPWRRRDLLLRFLPALWRIARGELRFVGVAPRSIADVQALSPDWRSLYLHAKGGVVTEAYVRYGNAPTEDELYSAEAFYSVAAGAKHDLKLILGFLRRLLKGS